MHALKILTYQKLKIGLQNAHMHFSTLLGTQGIKTAVNRLFFSVLLSKSEQKVLAPKQIVLVPCCANMSVTLRSRHQIHKHVSLAHLHRHTGTSCHARCLPFTSHPFRFPTHAQGKLAIPVLIP